MKRVLYLIPFLVLPISGLLTAQTNGLAYLQDTYLRLKGPALPTQCGVVKIINPMQRPLTLMSTKYNADKEGMRAIEARGVTILPPGESLVTKFDRAQFSPFGSDEYRIYTFIQDNGRLVPVNPAQALSYSIIDSGVCRTTQVAGKKIDYTPLRMEYSLSPLQITGLVAAGLGIIATIAVTVDCIRLHKADKSCTQVWKQRFGSLVPSWGSKKNGIPELETDETPGVAEEPIKVEVPEPAPGIQPSRNVREPLVFPLPPAPQVNPNKGVLPGGAVVTDPGVMYLYGEESRQRSDREQDAARLREAEQQALIDAPQPVLTEQEEQIRRLEDEIRGRRLTQQVSQNRIEELRGIPGSEAQEERENLNAGIDAMQRSMLGFEGDIIKMRRAVPQQPGPGRRIGGPATVFGNF